jgi:pyrimidine 5'-nucleotidase
MTWSVLFFDLDDTLYPKNNGLWEAIRERMTDYLRDPLGFHEEEIPELRQSYLETYGTTLRGLQINHSVDKDEYLAYVHDLPLEEYISPNPKLRDVLNSLPQQKWVFTNADTNHARRVLNVLGIEDCFDGIIDVRALGFLCKPQPKAYLRALTLVDESDPKECVLFEDSLRNLIPAQAVGITTVLVGSNELQSGADYALGNLEELPQVFPQLWWENNPSQ